MIGEPRIFREWRRCTTPSHPFSLSADQARRRATLPRRRRWVVSNEYLQPPSINSTNLPYFLVSQGALKKRDQSSPPSRSHPQRRHRFVRQPSDARKKKVFSVTPSLPRGCHHFPCASLSDFVDLRLQLTGSVCVSGVHARISVQQIEAGPLVYHPASPADVRKSSIRGGGGDMQRDTSF